MNPLISILVFIFGLFFGSFLNVVVDRLQSKETILKGRSHCEFCKKTLQWFDLIPLLSFLFLRGKCRYCHKNLSFYYPVIEFATAVMFVVTYVWISKTFSFSFMLFHLIYYLIIISSFIIIFFEDLKFGLIPDKIVIPTALVSFLYLLVNAKYLMLNNLFSALGTFAFFLLLFLITRGKGIGFGDVVLAFLLGLVLGFPKIILALYIAFLTGAFFGLILILWKKKKSLKETIPFGPFLIAGTVISLFLGDIIIPRAMLFLGLL